MRFLNNSSLEPREEITIDFSSGAAPGLGVTATRVDQSIKAAICSASLGLIIFPTNAYAGLPSTRNLTILSLACSKAFSCSGVTVVTSGFKIDVCLTSFVTRKSTWLFCSSVNCEYAFPNFS